MATTSNLKPDEDKFPVNTTGEPTEQFVSANDDFNDEPEGEEISDDEFDAAPLDDDEDLDDDEVKRIFPTEDEDLSDDDDEPYEGIRHEDDEDDDLVDDNMTGMPVVPSPS